MVRAFTKTAHVFNNTSLGRYGQYLALTCKTPIPKLLFLIKSSNKNLKNMAVILSRPTHILYQCAKFGDDRTPILTCATSNM